MSGKGVVNHSVAGSEILLKATYNLGMLFAFYRMVISVLNGIVFV